MDPSYRSSYSIPLSQEQVESSIAAVFRQIYLWMGAGLLVTAAVAWLVSESNLILVFARQPLFFYGLLGGELLLVIGLTAAIQRLSTPTALIMFFIYAALNGATMSVIFLLYTLSSIASTFVVTAGMFAIMSLLAYSTGLDLTRFGSLLFMGLIGLIIGSVVNLFWANSVLYWIVTFAGIVLFIGLTAYDTQRIRKRTQAMLVSGQEAAIAKLSLMGALSLYLDFVNLFLLLLRVVGRRR